MYYTMLKGIFYTVCLTLMNMSCINAMESADQEFTAQGEHGETYILRQGEWPHQTVDRLEMDDGVAKATCVSLLPLVAGLKPIIGYISCTCSSTEGYSRNERHRTIMIEAFRSILAYLAAEGHKEVIFPEALRKSPPCLAEYIRNPDNVPIISINDHEYTTKTTPH